MTLNVVDLGRIGYLDAMRLQEEYAGQIATGQRPPTLLLLEHPHVYTFGRRGHAANLLLGERALKDRGIEVHWVDRGGDITYHGPGQLVGYPLLPLKSLAPRPSVEDRIAAGDEAASTASLDSDRIPRADYVGYLRKLEQTIIVTLYAMGIAAAQRPGMTGVWVQPRVWARCRRCRPEDLGKPAKIASIGVKVDAHGVSRHGFALNVNPEMTYWDGIVPCGLAEQPVAAVADFLDPVPSMASVKLMLVDAFSGVFSSSPTRDWRSRTSIDFSS